MSDATSRGARARASGQPRRLPALSLTVLLSASWLGCGDGPAPGAGAVSRSHADQVAPDGGTAPTASTPGPKVLRIGSKKFTESVILGELLSQRLQQAGISATHRRELGGSQILWRALLRGDIDAYPEYTGTLRQELLRTKPDEPLEALLRQRGVAMTRSLGFVNQYALGMRRQDAERLGIRTLSDLARHPELRFGISDELMSRSDGWPALQRTYDLAPTSLRAMDHDVAYRALEQSDLDVVDLYTTDAEIARYGLVALEDDRHLFVPYEAVVLYRIADRQLAPRLEPLLRGLEGQLPASAMIALNHGAKFEHVDEGQLASRWLAAHRLPGGAAAARPPAQWAREPLWMRIARTTGDHVILVAISLVAAIALSVPLGIVCARKPALGRIVLALVGILQTVPSLALLVFMIPLVGIGPAPAIIALFLYSLLPIVRATYSGLRALPPALLESAQALGLTPLSRLCRIELPMASRSILSGVKTAAVINVGTATLGAIVGAGGYGQPILSGVRLADSRLILEGAVPAALMALAADGLFALAEMVLIPRGLRLPAQR